MEIKFIKDKVGSLSNDNADDVDVDIDNNVIIMMVNIIRLLDSDWICVISNKTFNFFSWYKYRLRKKFLKSGEAEFDKQEFHSSKRGVCMHDVNTDKIYFFYRFPCSIKYSTYFVNNKINEKVSPLSVWLQKLVSLLKAFDNA